MYLKLKMILPGILLGISLTFHSAFGMECKSQEGMELDSQEKLNKFVGLRAVELFKQLNNCSRYPNQAQRESPHIPGNDWEISKARINNQIMLVMYKKNKNIKASVALNKIFESPCVLDCVTASNLVLAKCISEIFNDSFDDLYESIECEEKNNIIYIGKLVALFSKPLDNLTIKNFSQPGGLVHFKNFPNYGQINPYKAYSNDNLITVEDGEGGIKYMGFGEEYKNGPLFYNEVKDYMVSSYYVGVSDLENGGEIFEIDDIIDFMGFDEYSSNGYPSSYKVKNCILEKYSEKTECFIKDKIFKEVVFNFMQVYPVFCLSFDKIKAEKQRLAELYFKTGK